MEVDKILENACTDVGYELTSDKLLKFKEYKDLIIQWNEKINLTAITDENELYIKHFIDSVKIFTFEPLKKCNKIIDIGTGAGFPGIPIKILSDEKEVLLLDSLNKRINFLNEVIQTLELKNINAIHGRAEEIAKKPSCRENFDAAVSRAVANLQVLSEICLPFVKVGGVMVAMKGPSVKDEIPEALATIKILGGEVEQILETNIDGTEYNHNLVIIRKIKRTPSRFPRKPGDAKKEPLKIMSKNVR